MVSVFDVVLKTARSKKHLMRHQYDAQKIYAGLLNEYEQGASAKALVNKAEKALREFTLTGSWVSKPYSHFLTAWTNKVLTVEELVGRVLDDDERRRYLDAAIS